MVGGILMKEFMGKNFLLETNTAILLYEKFAKKMPIFDYYCQINPQEIYENRKFDNLTEVWLADGPYGDYHKWHVMRAQGIGEEFITGDAASEEKFMKWAETVPYAIGNPLFHLTHMELETFFGIKELLNPATAKKIYRKTKSQLSHLPVRKMIEKSNVKVLCTIDDPTDDLKWHLLLQEEKKFKTVVLPSFKPDKAIDIEKDSFSDWVKELALASQIEINDFSSFLQALKQRITFFDSVGCRLADHDLEEVVYLDAEEEQIEKIFLKGINKKKLSSEEIAQYKGYLLVFLGQEYAKYNWVQQYHIGILRNNSSRGLTALGEDNSFDAINDKPIAVPLVKILDKLDSTNELPKTILHCVNPQDNEIIAAIAGFFQSEIKGKIQLSSFWWFNNQKEDMIKQMTRLCNIGLINNFIGMSNGSFGFMSYSRHDYFRRILCNFFGKLIEDGEYPNDIKLAGRIVQDICYNNALNYFGVSDKK